MDRQTRIDAFLDGNPGEYESPVWVIGSGRNKTRRALAEWLQGLPEAVFDWIAARGTPIWVVAPAIEQVCAEAVFSCEVRAEQGTSFHFARMVFFDRHLEECDYPLTELAVSGTMDTAVSKALEDKQLARSAGGFSS
jgi:hypothetical protein